MNIFLLVVSICVVLMKKVNSYRHQESQGPVFEDSSLESNIGNFLNYQPYSDDNKDELNGHEFPDKSEDRANGIFQNGKFAVPWLRDEHYGNKDEDMEAPWKREHWVKDQNRKNAYWGHYHDNGVNGFGFHFHHNPDFHRDHASCFPWGDQKRRPRPSAPPTKPTSAPARVTIDPRSTMPSLISSEVPNIDIRAGEDAGDRADNIVFPE